MRYMSSREGLWNVSIFIGLGEVPDRFIGRDSFLLSNVYNLTSKYCTFLGFYSLGVGDISHPVYESMARFFNSSSKLYTAIPKTLEKQSKLEGRVFVLGGSCWDVCVWYVV